MFPISGVTYSKTIKDAGKPITVAQLLAVLADQHEGMRSVIIKHEGIINHESTKAEIFDGTLGMLLEDESQFTKWVLGLKVHQFWVPHQSENRISPIHIHILEEKIEEGEEKQEDQGGDEE